MANLKDLIVNGAARIIGKTYSSEFVGNLTGNVTGSVSGNAGTATKLKTARSLKITDDGTNTSTGVDFDGSDTVTLKLPPTIKASLAGNAASSSSIAASSQLTSATAVDGFLEANKLKYATFTNYSAIGFIDNNGVIISIPWTDTKYGIQIALDDDNSTIKARGKLAGTWGNWKQLWKEGDSITAPSITATNGFTGNLTGNVTGNAETATKATGDKLGNEITATYATKTELTTALGDVETLLSKI